MFSKGKARFEGPMAGAVRVVSMENIKALWRGEA
jgi:hypothetical protein